VTPHGRSLASQPSGGTERAAKAKAEVKVIELPEDREAENPLVHSFEKVHTADNYQGGRKALDGVDELAAHEDALSELDMKEVIRTSEAARSVYRMDLAARLDFDDEEAEPEPGPEHHLYDEWDGARYLRAHCRLASEKPALPPRPNRKGIEPDPRTKEEVRRAFEALEQLRRPRSRLPHGSEVDIDALVERYASLRAGHEGPSHLYIERRRVAFDMATVLLLDLSSSSDAWINGRRVLDVERPALVAVADVLDELGAPFAVGGFFSHTHRDCRYVDFKGFDDDWPAARATLFAVEPQGYTRMGPALRHATTLLETAQVTRRTVLLLTDGRPTDYDRYEGRYGVTDVKKACDEAHARGVRVVALAVTDRRRPHLAAMFGEPGYEALSDPSEIAGRLAALEARLRL
jgi:nitric oxide reductase NorD protein